MTAIGVTSGDPSKVDVAGDTMTGDLILAGAGTDLTVGGVFTDTYQGITGDMARFMSTGLSTGLTSGGQITLNANPALVDISAATGWVVDYNSTPGTIGATNPQLTFVNYAGATGIVLTGPPAQQATFWLLNSASAIVQQASPPTRIQGRTHIFLGVTVQSGGTIFAIRNLPMVQSQPGVQIVDIMVGLGAFNASTQSNVISANGANLMINTTGGDLFIRAYGINAGVYQNPHFATLSAQTPANFRRATATNINPAFFNAVDIANYDPGGLGIITPIGGGANTSVVHRVFIAGSPVVNEQIIIQYGQNTYASLAAAEAAIGTGSFTVNPVFTGCVTGYIAATRVAVDLSDTTQARFARASKFANP